MEKIVDKIMNVYDKNLKFSIKERAIVRYGVNIVIITLISYICCLLVGYFLGILFESIIVLLSCSMLKKFSGGAHCSKFLNCTIVSIGVVNFLAWFGKYTYNYGYISKGYGMFIIQFIILLYAIWAIGEYAPADTPQKPIKSQIQREKLKKMSLLFIIIWYGFGMISYTFYKNFNIVSYLISLGILWQSFSITKLGYRLIHAFDRFLNLLKINK